MSSPSATVDTFIDGREILLNVDKILDDKQTWHCFNLFIAKSI